MSQGPAVAGDTSLTQCGREITPADIALIVNTREMYPTLCHWEFVRTVCEVLGWLRASGRPKVDACTKLLERLEAAGVLALPAKMPDKVRANQKWSSRPSWGPQTDPGEAIEGELGDIGPIR